MTSPDPADAPPSLFGITVRRAITSGRVYLVLGCVFSSLFAVGLGFAAESFGGYGALLVPVYAALGGMGALMVFTSDRIKGVFEYLIAYGISPRRLFANVLGASCILVAIVLAVSMSVALLLSLGRGRPFPLSVTELLLGYSLPMSFASVAFAATVGMFWTSLSSPREGMNSPIGLVPILGVAPSLLTLIAAIATGRADSLALPGAAVLVVVLLVLLLLRFMERLMPRERLLSPT